MKSRAAAVAPPAGAGTEAVVDRPRVVRALRERLERHGLVQVHGPPGIGKTTAVRQVAASLDVPVAWLTLSDWHREPGRLVEDLLEAFAVAVPRLGGIARRPRARPGELVATARELGAAIGHMDGIVLVLDDCHLVADMAESRAVISALVGAARPGLRAALLGRMPLPLQGADVDDLRPEAYVGQELLDADIEEARQILLGNGSTTDPEAALAATGGWVAGLVFESWRTQSSEDVDPLALYLEAEVRPLLDPKTFEFLVETSVFEEVTASRAAALGYDGAPDLLTSLRRRPIPATWTPGDACMRLHPRVREILAAELAARPRGRAVAVLGLAAEAYEREGRIEHAVDLYVRAGATDAVRRLLPGVIARIVERGDLELAERLISADPDESEPQIVLAQLMLASARQRAGRGVALLERIGDERLPSLIASEPRIAPFVSAVLASQMRIDDAVRVLEATPPGRAADVTRLLLSVLRDDPGATAPGLVGDGLDPIVARALWGRGMLLELHTKVDESLVRVAGLPEPPRPPTALPEPGGLGELLALAMTAVDERDLAAARNAVAALAERPGDPWALLVEAEVGVRLARDAELTGNAVERLRRMPAWGVPFYRELGQVWQGGGLLLSAQDEAAARVLREAATSMRRGDRVLELPSALVYLSEAEWRLGDEAAADGAVDEAYAVARRQGSLRRLLLSLADFPGVLSRRLDAEPSGDSEWHGLGRALALGATGAPASRGHAAARVREYGEPALVCGGVAARPKIRKSLELVSFLASRPRATATRTDVLTALWNGRDDDSTRAYLRQALRHLRDVLPPGVTIASRDDRLRLDGAISSESGEVAALLAEAARHLGDRRRALLLDAHAIVSRGVFLEGSDDVAWVDDCRARQRGTLADIRLDLAEQLVADERYLEALGFADEALADDAMLERGWRLRMQALAMLGDADGVLAAFRRCHAALAEIGLEPSRTTVDLARALRS